MAKTGHAKVTALLKKLAQFIHDHTRDANERRAARQWLRVLKHKRRFTG